MGLDTINLIVSKHGENMKIIINNTKLTKDQLQSWKYKRIKSSYKLLQHHIGDFHNNRLECAIRQNNVLLAEKLLAEIKYDLGSKKLESLLSMDTKISNKFVEALARMSFGKRKFSQTNFIISKNGISAKQLMDKFDEIQLTNSNLNRDINLNANPDHYVSKGHPNKKQEVIETTGSAILPSHFFLQYGDQTGLQSKFDPTYKYEVPGAAYTPNGVLIGGVRHQFGEDEENLLVKTLVEFPILTPNCVVHQHELHLACEFSHWISDILGE